VASKVNKYNRREAAIRVLSKALRFLFNIKVGHAGEAYEKSRHCVSALDC
jgi:hypothetical protein